MFSAVMMESLVTETNTIAITIIFIKAVCSALKRLICPDGPFHYGGGERFWEKDRWRSNERNEALLQLHNMHCNARYTITTQ